MKPARMLPSFTVAAALMLSACLTAAGAAPDPGSPAGASEAVASQEKAATAPGPNAALAGEAKRMGMEAYENNELAKAAEYLAAAHKIDPEDMEVAGRLGFALKETGAYEKALAILEKVVEKKPDDYYVWWWISDTQRLLGRYGDALKAMEKSRDVAPQDKRQELQEYVDYTATLGERAPSWKNLAQHVDFAERHRNNRRVRRQIAEYAAALEVAPAPAEGNKEEAARLMWLNQEMGTQHNYIEEPEVAADYFLQALAVAEKAGLRADVMRSHQNLAVAWRMLYDRAPAKSAEVMERVLAAWRASMAVAVELEDPVYTRYTRGRLLDALSAARPPDDPEVVKLRAENDKEVPWKGPVNEYSTAEAVAGEAACRLREGDTAGARILLEMALPYFEQSNYLSDYQRAVQLNLSLAHAWFLLGQAAESLKAADAAAAKAELSRQFVDAEAFNRGGGGVLLRGVAAARARALARLGDHEKAFDAVEAYKSRRLLDLLGSSIVDDSARTDAASELEALHRRIPQLEARLAAARAAGNAPEDGRIAALLDKDQRRAAWLEKKVEFITPENLNFKGLEAAGLDAVSAALPGDGALADLLFDAHGGVAVVVRKDGADSVLLDAAAPELTAASESFWTLPAAERKVLAESLHARIAAPLLEKTGNAARLCLCPDAASEAFPFAALESGGAPWSAAVALGFADSASQYTHFLSRPAVPADRIRLVAAREDRAGLFAAPDGLPPVVVKTGTDAGLDAPAADAKPGDVLHLAAAMDTTPPYAMLCPALLNGADGPKEYPAARLIGERIPAALFVLDWSPAAPDSAARPELLPIWAEAARNAGAGAFLGLLQPVDPDAAAALFGGFYRRLPAMDKVRALAESQAEYRAAHPDSAAWAAFVLRGDPR